MDALIQKWDQFYSQSGAPAPCPSQVLAEHAHLLPKTGTALDLACGLGANALFLARNGLAVTAMDISNMAIEQLKTEVRQKGLAINACQQNITAASLQENSFDVIVVSRFLDRTLMNAIIEALKPNGLLFYQTFRRDKQDQSGPQNPDYLLAENELLQLFLPLTVIFYNEYAQDPDSGLSNEAQFIGRKPSRTTHD